MRSVTVDVRARVRGLWRVRLAARVARWAPPVARLLVRRGFAVETSVAGRPWTPHSTVSL